MENYTKLTTKEFIWMGIIFWAIIFTACEAPFSFTFETRLQTWQLWSDFIISSLFIADLYITFKNKKNIEKAQNTLPLTPKPKHWINSLLIIDFLACIPFDLISYFFELDQAITFLNLIRLFRLVRIVKILNVLGSLTFIPKSFRVKLYIISSIVIVHWITCGWLLLESPIGKTRAEQYINAIYWSITTLTTIGYGDITPSTNIGKFYTMVVMILGVGVYGIVIGQVSQIFANSAKMKEQTRERLHDINLFMKHYNIPERLQKATFGYYRHIYSKRLSDNDQQIISDLPQALQLELKTYMNIKMISNVQVFKNCSASCLKEVAMALEQMFYSPGENIIQIGSTGQEMFIIGHGIVDIILKDGNVITSLHEGQFFGEVALIQETTRNASVRAQTYCDLYKLDKSKFIKIINDHPELLANIQKITKDKTSKKPDESDKDLTAAS